MQRERVAFRTSKTDNEMISAIAAAIPRDAFATLTSVIKVALLASAELARRGELSDILAAANKRAR